ncbi:MAG: dihydroorotate dehydrogenase (quinone), partial [Helicobacter sp.]|nr:dihydroorotate dehydrogenase (quinone) [Helicobacter sp.]
GLNSQGIELFAQHLKMLYPFAIPLGVNIAKNKTTPQEKALDDYCLLAKNLESCSDYLSINLSSPNTPGLRDLANKSFVQELFIALRTFYSKPLYLKISPDLEIDSILELVEVAINNGANGIIATNTTEDYTFLKNPYSTGGVSGRALTAKSRDILRQIAKVYFKKTTLVSVGGIFDAKEAYERITLGANLIQVYSGLIFEGPKVTWNINHALKELLKSDGLESISQAVGVKL